MDDVIINDKCKVLAQKVKEIIDTKSSFADWFNNQNVRNQLKLGIKICLIKIGYPPQYSPEAFTKVMEQVENFEENSGEVISSSSSVVYRFPTETSTMMVAESPAPYGTKKDE